MIDKEKKYFADPESGRLNSDDDPTFLGQNEWQNMENLRSGSTDKGVTGTMESIGSNVIISTPQPSVTFLEIGSAVETERSRACYFKYNTTGPWHKIVCYDEQAGIEYDVLLSSQVTGGLGFSKDSIIHSAEIIDGKLYWPDGTNNQPRKINIDAAIKANNPSYVTDEVPYTFPINFSEITIIKPPPPLSPNIQKAQDVAFENNFIATDSFMFAFQYIWYDNETTVLGTYSPSSRLNKPTDVENYIQVTMDFLEVIPATVRIVRLICRFSNSNNAFVAKTWDKEIASQAAEIANQNNHVQVLSFNFYNNITGEAIPSEPINLVLKPFDSVPIFSQAMAAARNRLFMGNNTEGYNTPGTTSLSLASTEIDISAANLSQNLISFSHRNGRGGGEAYGYSGWYVFLTTVSPIGYYAIAATEQLNTLNGTIPTLPAAPTTVAFGGLVFRGSTQTEVVLATAKPGTFRWDGPFVTTTANIVTITGTTTSIFDVFKSQSQYKFGNVFYDFAMRKCGVVTNDGLIFEIPARDFDYTQGVNSIVWSLSNANALNEIPDWAYYYTPVRTLNLRTRYFIQSYTNAAKYATKDANGNYVFSSNTFVTGTIGIGLNTTALIQSGLGYVYTPGDVCILIRSDNNISILPVIGQDGNYVIVKAEDLGDLTNDEFVFELYIPYQTSDQEPFYEVGQMYRILEPGTTARRYETLSDIFIPDAYVLTRNYSTATYFAEAMSPNDLYFQRWDNDGGKINLITRLGQVVKKNSISFSNNFIPNTSINGLSTFDAIDEKSLPIECGALRKLIVTSKVQDELGIVMLAGCEEETASIYIGEIQQYGSNTETNLVASLDVIGTINVLKGSYGTVNPESWVEYRGAVYWADAFNNRIVQYAGNGLFAISNYKMTRFWKQWFQQFLSMTSAEIEALGGRPFIFMTVDPRHDELLISIPKLSNTPPKGYLPDYPSAIYPFDILDFQEKTIVYELNLGAGRPRWRGAFTFYTEGFMVLKNNLYSFKQGSLWLHNQTNSTNNFYGVQYTSKIMCVSNKDLAMPKVYDNISIEANQRPYFVYFYSAYPIQQSSDLADFSFRDIEGVWYSTILRNKLIPTNSGYTTDGLLTGEKMRNVSLQIMMEFNPTSSFLELKFANFGYQISLGHNNLK